MDDRKRVSCPACGATGTRVQSVTLYALLKRKHASDITTEFYRFCSTPACDVVYYAEQDREVFRKEALRVRVGIKETSAPRPVCYCFHHSVESIAAEIAATGTSTAVEDIKTRLQEGCWCETWNPQGRCCVGVVTRVSKEVHAASQGLAVPMPEVDCHSDAGCELTCDGPGPPPAPRRD